jgi:hypothetical protein
MQVRRLLPTRRTRVAAPGERGGCRALPVDVELGHHRPFRYSQISSRAIPSTGADHGTEEKTRLLATSSGTQVRVPSAAIIRLAAAATPICLREPIIGSDTTASPALRSRKSRMRKPVSVTNDLYSSATNIRSAVRRSAYLRLTAVPRAHSVAAQGHATVAVWTQESGLKTLLRWLARRLLLRQSPSGGANCRCFGHVPISDSARCLDDGVLRSDDTEVHHRVHFDGHVVTRDRLLS